MNELLRNTIHARSILIVLSIVAAGCQSTTYPEDGPSVSNQNINNDTLVFGMKEETTEEPDAVVAGAKLWEQNCIRCHNPRTPASLSDAQWKIVMHHMRVRANLTAEEHESILRFLQAAN